MLKIIVFLSLAVVCIGFSPSAGASILLGPSAYYSMTKSTDQTGFLGGNSNVTNLNGDGKLGFLIEGTVLYLGGIYSYESASADGGSKMSGTVYGPSIGVFNGAFALIGSYLLNGSRTYTSNAGAESKLSQGTGYRLDVSYVAGLSGSIGIGPQLTYKSVKYAKSTPAGATSDTSNTYEESMIEPSIIMWFRF